MTRSVKSWSPRSISLGGHDPGSLTLVQGHHKNPEIKVSFGKECMSDCHSAVFVKCRGKIEIKNNYDVVPVPSLTLINLSGHAEEIIRITG